MKIKVAPGIRVCHDGKVYADGATAEVPDSVGAQWLVSGWVQHVGGKRAGKAAAAKQDAAQE